jgi:hypothetical protein
MIFHEPLVRPILRGEKTTHRRPLRLPRPSRRGGWSSPWRPPKVGESLAIQGTDRRIRITAVERDRLALPTKVEAKAEGYSSPTAFVAAWMLEHDTLLRRARRADPEWLPPPDMLLGAFEQRCTGEPVWVIRFQLDADDRQFLAPADRPRFSELGYTTTMDVLDAGVCPDPALVDFYADRNRRRFEERAAQIRREVAAERFERARRAAEARGVDVGEQVRAVERMAAALERRASEDAA